jgi:Glycosyltransferase Family 4
VTWNNKVTILVLAPHPFYQERGSPIALHLILKALSERGEEVDVLVYQEGKETNYNGVTIYRSPKIPFMSGIRPGFSWKKVICDILMFLKAIQLVLRKQYHVIHAVEESVYMALIFKWLSGIPYVYDMDSSLAQQMVEKYPFLQPFIFLFNFFEKLAVRNATAVVPVCDALADFIDRYHPKQVVILRDVSLLNDGGAEQAR